MTAAEVRRRDADARGEAAEREAGPAVLVRRRPARWIVAGAFAGPLLAVGIGLDATWSRVIAYALIGLGLLMLGRRMRPVFWWGLAAVAAELLAVTTRMSGTTGLLGTSVMGACLLVAAVAGSVAWLLFGRRLDEMARAHTGSGAGFTRLAWITVLSGLVVTVAGAAALTLWWRGSLAAWALSRPVTLGLLVAAALVLVGPLLVAVLSLWRSSSLPWLRTTGLPVRVVPEPSGGKLRSPFLRVTVVTVIGSVIFASLTFVDRTGVVAVVPLIDAALVVAVLMMGRHAWGPGLTFGLGLAALDAVTISLGGLASSPELPVRWWLPASVAGSIAVAVGATWLGVALARKASRAGDVAGRRVFGGLAIATFAALVGLAAWSLRDGTGDVAVNVWLPLRGLDPSIRGYVSVSLAVAWWAALTWFSAAGWATHNRPVSDLEIAVRGVLLASREAGLDLPEGCRNPDWRDAFTSHAAAWAYVVLPPRDAGGTAVTADTADAADAGSVDYPLVAGAAAVARARITATGSQTPRPAADEAVARELGRALRATRAASKSSREANGGESLDDAAGGSAPAGALDAEILRLVADPRVADAILWSLPRPEDARSALSERTASTPEALADPVSVAAMDSLLDLCGRLGDDPVASRLSDIVTGARLNEESHLRVKVREPEKRAANLRLAMDRHRGAPESGLLNRVATSRATCVVGVVTVVLLAAGTGTVRGDGGSEVDEAALESRQLAVSAAASYDTDPQRAAAEALASFRLARTPEDLAIATRALSQVSNSPLAMTIDVTGYTDPLRTVATSPSGRFVAMNESGWVKLFDLTGGSSEAVASARFGGASVAFMGAYPQERLVVPCAEEALGALAFLDPTADGARSGDFVQAIREPSPDQDGVDCPNELAVSADGTLLVSWGRETAPVVWRLVDGLLDRTPVTWTTIPTSDDTLTRDVLVSPDGSKAAEQLGAEVQVIDLVEGTVLSRFSVPPDPDTGRVSLDRVVWSADGGLLATSARALRVWDPLTGVQVAETAPDVPWLSDSFGHTMLLPRPGELWAGRLVGRNRVELFDVVSGAPRQYFTLPQPDESVLIGVEPIEAGASQDGTRVVIGVWVDRSTRSMTVWDTVTETFVMSDRRVSGERGAAVLGGSGTLLLADLMPAASYSQPVGVWRMDEWSPGDPRLVGSSVSALAATETVLAASALGTQLVDAPSFLVLPEGRRVTVPASDPGWSGTLVDAVGERVAMLNLASPLHSWQLVVTSTSGDVVAELTGGVDTDGWGVAPSLAMNGDGSQVAVLDASGLRIIDLESRAERTAPIPTTQITNPPPGLQPVDTTLLDDDWDYGGVSSGAVHLSADATEAVGIVAGQRLVRWDLTDPEPSMTLNIPITAWRGLSCGAGCLSPDGSTVADLTELVSGRVHLRDTRSGEVTQTVSGLSPGPIGIAMNTDGSVLAIVERSGAGVRVGKPGLHVLDQRSGQRWWQPLPELPRFATDGQYAVAVSASGNSVAVSAASAASRLRPADVTVWRTDDPESGTPVDVPLQNIGAMTFSPDEKVIYASDGRLVKVFNPVEVDRLLERACAIAPRDPLGSQLARGERAIVLCN